MHALNLDAAGIASLVASDANDGVVLPLEEIWNGAWTGVTISKDREEIDTLPSKIWQS